MRKAGGVCLRLFLCSLFSCTDDLNAVSLAFFCSPCPEIAEMVVNGIHGAEVIAV